MKTFIGILLILGILSCQDRQRGIGSIDTENLTVTQIDSLLTEFKFQYEMPIVLDSTNQVLIPISTVSPGRGKKFRKDRYSSDGYYSDDDPDDYSRYWNVLFYNRETGKNRLLTEDKIRISRIHAIKNDHMGIRKIMRHKILYEIGDIDYNEDNKLNGNDPIYLFSSEINGENLKRISPPDEDLQYFEVIPNSKEILMKTIRDIDQDSIFNSYNDESIWYKAALENGNWKLEELIDSTRRKKIENLYFEQWLKKKS